MRKSLFFAIMATVAAGIIAGACSMVQEQLNMENLKDAAIMASGTRYDRPMINGIRLDWCRDYATDCGDKAADIFCQSKGHSRSLKWETEDGGGRTIIISDNEICRGSHCTAFKYVICK
ncbi:MAG TPA: hypothetical protein PK544_07705 [Spirochaetota bacterium]|nr:hypothetical protein [Spirochaetota bacterium]HPJ37788.1 hypothetical protein [Spirochaetota bacterium]HPQ54271.1 hypothetical protein [Spirochaetota bacterium]